MPYVFAALVVLLLVVPMFLPERLLVSAWEYVRAIPRPRMYLMTFAGWLLTAVPLLLLAATRTQANAGSDYRALGTAVASVGFFFVCVSAFALLLTAKRSPDTHRAGAESAAR